eukprot:6486000-Amphidinium_carterae.2
MSRSSADLSGTSRNGGMTKSVDSGGGAEEVPQQWSTLDALCCGHCGNRGRKARKEPAESLRKN